MLKVNIKKGEQSEIVATGSTSEIMAEIVVMISSIYGQMQTADKIGAEEFRLGLFNVMTDPNGPMWKPLEGTEGVAFKM